jgi:hypothetical protein
VVVRPEEHRRWLVMESFLRSWTAAEEGARAGDVAVGSGSTGVEDVEEKMGLLPTGWDDDGEWRPGVVIVSRDHGREQRSRGETSEVWSKRNGVGELLRSSLTQG